MLEKKRSRLIDPSGFDPSFANNSILSKVYSIVYKKYKSYSRKYRTISIFSTIHPHVSVILSRFIENNFATDLHLSPGLCTISDIFHVAERVNRQRSIRLSFVQILSEVNVASEDAEAVR